MVSISTFPEDVYLLNRDGSTETWTVSELGKHASCLWFAGWAKPLALNSNATRTIYNNWCFESAVSAHWILSLDSFACCLQLPPRNFKHSDGVIPKMSSDSGPQCDSRIFYYTVIQPKRQNYGYKNILMNNNNAFASLVVCINQKIPLGSNNAHISKNNKTLNCSYSYLVWFYWQWRWVEVTFLLRRVKTLKSCNEQHISFNWEIETLIMTEIQLKHIK